MRTYNAKKFEQELFLRNCGNKGGLVVPVLIKKGRNLTQRAALRPKPQHLQYSKAVAILCDATEDYGSFVGGVFAKEKYDKAISAVRNLQAHMNMAI